MRGSAATIAGRNRRDRVVQVLPQILFGDRQGGEVGELAVSGIISPRKREASSSTRQSGPALRRWTSAWFDCNRARHPPGVIVHWKECRKILVSAGEASGDLYASLVVEELRRACPDAEFFGCTGPRLRAAGVRTVVDAASLAVVGLVEVVAHIPRIYGEYRKLLAAAARRKARPRHPHRFARFPPARGPQAPRAGHPRGLSGGAPGLGVAQGPRQRNAPHPAPPALHLPF